LETDISTKIAGEIVLAADHGKTLRKWRELFGVTQTELASELGVSASVISDYESGRRKSPGVEMVRRIVKGIMEVDEKKGGRVQKAYERIMGSGINTDAILDMREFSSPVGIKKFSEIVGGEVIANKELLEKDIYGYTVLDSLKAILELNSEEFLKIYGPTSERALVFTKVSSGRSPFIAIRVSSIKPGAVVLHGLKLQEVDSLGIKIAEKEKIPVILSKIESVENLIKELRKV